MHARTKAHMQRGQTFSVSLSLLFFSSPIFWQQGEGGDVLGKRYVVKHLLILKEGALE